MSDYTRVVVFALLGAFFAAVTQVLSKPASDRLGPNVVSLTRAVVMTLLFVAIVIVEARHPGVTGGGETTDGSAARPATGREAGLTRPVLYAIAVGAGVAASLSWFFGYKALRLGNVGMTYPLDKLSVVIAVLLAAIFLGERPSLLNCGGIALMAVGAVMVTHKA